jgi:hypothetical protein
VIRHRMAKVCIITMMSMMSMTTMIYKYDDGNIYNDFFQSNSIQSQRLTKSIDLTTKHIDFIDNSDENPNRRLLDTFYLDLKRKSDPAIRNSFYNKLFDIDETSEGLFSPQKDFRKFSLPSPLNNNATSSTSSGAFANVRCFTSKFSESSMNKFNWTVRDDQGYEIKNSLFDSICSPLDEYKNDICLHFEENFVKSNDFATTYDELNEKFKRKLKEIGCESLFNSQSSTETVINTKICKKCGHDILRL